MKRNPASSGERLVSAWMDKFTAFGKHGARKLPNTCEKPLSMDDVDVFLCVRSLPLSLIRRQPMGSSRRSVAKEQGGSEQPSRGVPHALSCSFNIMVISAQRYH